MFVIPDTEIPGHDCPQSYITGTSNELVQIGGRLSTAKQATGGSLGGDVLKTNSKLIDVLTTLESLENQIEYHRREAESMEQ